MQEYSISHWKERLDFLCTFEQLNSIGVSVLILKISEDDTLENKRILCYINLSRYVQKTLRFRDTWC